MKRPLFTEDEVHAADQRAREAAAQAPAGTRARSAVIIAAGYPPAPPRAMPRERHGLTRSSSVHGFAVLPNTERFKQMKHLREHQKCAAPFGEHNS